MVSNVSHGLGASLRAAEPPIWAGRPHPAITLLRGIAVVLLMVIVLGPIWLVVSTSLAPQSEVTRTGGYVLWPQVTTFAAYEQVFRGGTVTNALMVSAVVTTFGTIFSLTLTTFAAFGLSRRDSLFHRGLLTMVLLTFLFSPGMIPVYLVVKQLNMLDTLWALIVPGSISAFNLVIIRGFIMNLPAEIMDAARIDGASEWRRFRSIVLPLCRPVLAVIGLFYAVGYWNAFFNAMLYLDDSAKWPLQLVMRTIVLQGAPMNLEVAPGEIPPPGLSVRMAVIVISIVPVLVAYPFVQRHFTKGTLTGALKG